MRFVFSGLMLAFAIAACRPSTAQVHKSRLTLAPCRIAGLSMATLCGKFDVPEDRQHPEGKTLTLRVVLVPAVAAKAEPDPVFMLAGGPGQSAIESLPRVASVAMNKVHVARDIVLVDQRGTGASNPLDCVDPQEASDLSSRLAGAEPTVEALRRCVARWSADTRFYHTSVAMQDVDDVRAALGYAKINLWGGSYGTRAALVYLREHGEHVRAAILDGVAPLSFVLPQSIAPDAEGALELLLVACKREDACHKAFPLMRVQFASLLAQFEKGPLQVRVPDPQSGLPTLVKLTREGFVSAVKGQLYTPALASLLPLTVDAAARGDWAPFVAQHTTTELDSVKLYRGALYAVACAEDVPSVNETTLRQAAKGTFVGEPYGMTFLTLCGAFPRASVRADFRDPVHSDVPVLLLSGEADPVTPPRWAEDAARTLTHATSVVVPGAGHGVSMIGCVPRLIHEFLKSGDGTAIDTSCVKQQRRPAFFTSYAGPPP